MLTAEADRLPGALADLDPGNRALLDLSLRRGVSDAEIGELLRKDPEDVARGRDAVLELLADALGLDGPDRRERVRQAVTALPDEAWRPRPAPAPPPARAPEKPAPPPPGEERAQPKERGEAKAERPEAREPEPKPREREPGRGDFYFAPEPRRRGRGGLLAILGLLAVLGAVLALVLAGGDDDEPSAPDQRGSEPAPTPGPDQGDGGEPGVREERLRPVGGGRGSGRLTVTDAGATVTIRGLPDAGGAYEVWLYDSIVRAESLGTIPGGSGRLEAALPADARSYRFLDVSREPADGNPNHSGETVMRAPLGELLGE